MLRAKVAIETSAWIVIAAGVAASLAGFLFSPLRTPLFGAAVTCGLLLVGLGAYSAWVAAVWGEAFAATPSTLALVVGVFTGVYPWLVSATDAYTIAVSFCGLVATIASGQEARFANRMPILTRRRPIA